MTQDVASALRRYRELADADLHSPDGELATTLDLVVAFVERVLPVDGGASVVLWDEDRDTFTTSASTVPGQVRSTTAQRVRSGGVTRWIIDHRRPQAIGRLVDDPFGANAMLVEHGLKAYVGVPMIAGGRVRGVLYAMHLHERAWTDDEVSFLQAVGTRAALAITRIEADAAAQLTLDRARALYAMSRTLMEADDPAVLAERLVNGLVDSLAAEGAMLLGLEGTVSRLPDRTVAGPAEDALATVAVDRLVNLDGTRLWDAAGPLRRDHSMLTDVAEIVDAEDYLFVPLAAHGVVHGVLLIVGGTDQPPFTSRDAGFVQAMANLVTVAIENLALVVELHRRATTDVLTGVPNRRHLVDLGDQLLALGRRTEAPLAGLMIDIDHFKLVNDEHGHAVGDEVLRHVAAVLSASLRDADVLGRYGGEEFAAVLPSTPPHEAQEVAERLRAEVESRPFRSGSLELQIRVSVGGASARPEDTLAGLLDRADEQLYLAKRAGRNRVRYE